MAQPTSQSKRKLADADLEVNEEKRPKLLASDHNDTTLEERLRSPFERLPTELFNIIYEDLTPSSILAKKFVCRQFNERLGNLPSSQMDNLREEMYYDDLHPKAKEKELGKIAKIMVDYESRSPERLSELTCSHCAQARGNNKKGYSDDNFDQNNRNRMCLPCIGQLRRREKNAVHFRRTYLVKGKTHVICCDCREALETIGAAGWLMSGTSALIVWKGGIWALMLSPIIMRIPRLNGSRTDYLEDDTLHG
jgi:hypothetical protein